MNLGWAMGYRKQYYSWENDFVDISNVSYNNHEGYNPEACYDTLVSKYYILSIDDFNKNYSNTLVLHFKNRLLMIIQHLLKFLIHLTLQIMII